MRYSRQETLIGSKGQELLNQKIVAIVGLGALGTNSSNLLARAGVNLVLIDNDKVDLTNLQRQNIFSEKDINNNKALAAKDYLEKVNSQIKILAYDVELKNENINLINADLVLDCTDNLETRFLINDYCSKHKIPWIHAAAIENQGNLFNVIPGKACFNCIYENINSMDRCEDLGVLNTITTLISSLQVNESLKILLNKNYEDSLIRVNLENNSFERIKVNKNPECEVCNGGILNKKFKLELCKTKATLMVKTNTKLNMKKIKDNFGELRDAGNTLLLEIEGEQVIVNNNGEIIFKHLREDNKVMRIATEIYDAGK
ncbi:MAG: HesA/MoeB/ThiF family protein [Nanoarchaeota archaeon]